MIQIKCEFYKFNCTDHCVIFTLLYVKMKTKSVIVAQISFCKYIPDINLLTKKVCSLFFFQGQ